MTCYLLSKSRCVFSIKSWWQISYTERIVFESSEVTWNRRAVKEAVLCNIYSLFKIKKIMLYQLPTWNKRFFKYIYFVEIGLKCSTSLNYFLNSFNISYPIATTFSEIIWTLIVILLTKNELSLIINKLKISFFLIYRGCGRGWNLEYIRSSCNY